MATKKIKSIINLDSLIENDTTQQNTKHNIPTTNSSINNNNIIPCNPNEIDYTRSNNYLNDNIQPSTHRYPTKSRQQKSTPMIIPPDSLKVRQSSRFLSPKLYTNNTIHALTVKVALQPFPGETTYLVLDGDTGMAQSYKPLIKYLKTRTIWENGMCKELGRLIQGFNNTQGTNTCKMMLIEEIKQIPQDQTIMYARIVLDCRTQK